MIKSATLTVLVRQAIVHLVTPLPKLSWFFLFVFGWILYFLSPFFSFLRCSSTICSTNGYLSFAEWTMLVSLMFRRTRPRMFFFCSCYLGVGEKEGKENAGVNIKSKKEVNNNKNININININGSSSDSQK